MAVGQYYVDQCVGNVEVVAADKKCTGWNIDQKDMFETKQQLSISER